MVEPRDWSSIPLNRRRRRTLRKEGFAVHLYSGEEGGYTLGRSMKSLGGPHKKLVELDRKQGTDYDLLRDGGPYAGLLRAAVEG